ncbi:MAG TPA: tetratricopeptide repeat protein, partial [bacterium]|nr:tetratricopeptide repeat protein [bacterium]
FETYAKLNPKDSAVYDYIGLCYFGLKDSRKSIESFQKLLESQPTNALVHFRLSAVYEDMKDYANAEKQVQDILDNDNKSVDAWVRLGILYDKENKKELTAKTIDAGLKANPNHPELVLMKGMLAQENESLIEAEADYRKVIDSELAFKNKQQADYNLGTLVQAYFDLATTLDKENKFNEAMDTMKKVIQVQPDNAEAYNYAGYSYADKNQNLDEAQKDVETALKLDPNNAYYLDSLGWVYFHQKNYSQAKDAFEKALKQLPEKKQKDDAVIYDHLAQTDIKLDQNDEAVIQWKKSLELDPNNKDFAAELQKYQPAGSGQ